MKGVLKMFCSRYKPPDQCLVLLDSFCLLSPADFTLVMEKDREIFTGRKGRGKKGGWEFLHLVLIPQQLSDAFLLLRAKYQRLSKTVRHTAGR